MATLSAPANPTLDAGRSTADEPAPLRAAHTPNFPALLRRLGASLLVTTYQAGKLVMVRDEGDHLNTHYRTFKAPMGLALADGGAKLALEADPEERRTYRRCHGAEIDVGQISIFPRPDAGGQRDPEAEPHRQ